MSREDKDRMSGKGEQLAPNPVQMQRYLGGLDYPVSKEEILTMARKKGADDQILSTLEQLPDHEYKSPIEISRAVSRRH